MATSGEKGASPSPSPPKKQMIERPPATSSVPNPTGLTA